MAGNCNSAYTADYSWVHSDTSIFPRHIFQVNVDISDSALTLLTDNIKKGAAPPFLICRYDNAPAGFINRLAGHGFRQVMQWPGMAVETMGQTGYYHNPDFSIIIKTIKHEDEILSWADIVETCLFKGEKFDRNTLVNLTEKPGFTFYMGFIDGQPAGTLLSFSDDHQVTGFYMVTTVAKHRKKGVARSLVNKAVFDARLNMNPYVVLESTPEGLSLYQHTGFKEYCKFAIYWMLGY